MRIAKWVLPVLLALVAAGCRSGPWEPADPLDRDAVVSVTGTLLRLDEEPDGSVRIEVGELRPAAGVLAGRERLAGRIPAEHRGNFEGVLRALEPGRRVEVSGYPARLRDEPSVIELRPVTALDIWPDGPPPGPVEAERAADEEGYRHHVMGRRQYLLEHHLGDWIAIAGGRAFPVNEYGTAVAPAPTMDAAVAAAEAAVPEARHRFVFRLGEEGDLEQPLGGAEMPHVLGVWFLAELERPDIEMRGLGPRQPIWFVKDGKRVEITAKGPDDRMYLRPEVGPPGRPGVADALYGLSTGFGGTAVLPAETAARARLELFEVPGRITIEGLMQSGVCRRARARFRFPGTDLDFALPVAIWPDRN